jgi:hypothetical protein
MTERLQNAVEAGGVLGLFRLLADWPDDELRALVTDCEAYYVEACESIDGKFKAAMFTPKVFFSNRNAKAVTKARDDANMQALAVTSEICSVAFYYLGEEAET